MSVEPTKRKKKAVRTGWYPIGCGIINNEAVEVLEAALEWNEAIHTPMPVRRYLYYSDKLSAAITKYQATLKGPMSVTK